MGEGLGAGPEKLHGESVSRGGRLLSLADLGDSPGWGSLQRNVTYFV